MSETCQEIKITCQSRIAKGAKAANGLPFRNWKITLTAMQQGKEQKGRLSMLLDRVDYILHDSFENPRQTIYKEPYVLKEKGWGSFDLQVVLHFIHDWASPQKIWFDINFAKPTYHTVVNVVIDDPSPELRSLLIPAGSYSSLEGSSLAPPSSQLAAHTSVTSLSTSVLPPVPALQTEIGHLYASDTADGIISGHTNEPVHDLNNTVTNRVDKTVIDYTKGLYYDDSDRDSMSVISYDQDMEGFCIEDDVYGPGDIDRIHPIHSLHLDPETCLAWGVPGHFNMQELARRLSYMSKDQIPEFHSIVRQNLTDDSALEEHGNELVIDLYSLGPAVLNQLWDYTESIRESV